MAAAKAANSTGDAELAVLKRQLADEKGLREALEDRLNRTEENLAHLEKALSRKNDAAENRIPASPSPEIATSVRTDNPEKNGTWLSLNPIQFIILFLIFVLGITLFSTLVFRRPQGNNIKEPQLELQSGVRGAIKMQANAQPQINDQNRPQTESPLPTAAEAAARLTGARASQPEKPLSAHMDPETQVPETSTPQLAIRKSLTNIERESKETGRIPAATTPKKVTGKV